MANDININPEMINNLVNMLKTNDNTNNSNLNNINAEEISEKLKSININEVLSNFSGAQTNNQNTNNTQGNSNTIDMETIIKIKTIMEKMNTQNDANSNLLYSLKPYLRESKQAKLDQYANLMKLSQITNLFKNEKEK